MDPSLSLSVVDIVHGELSSRLAISKKRMRLGSTYGQWLFVKFGLQLLQHGKLLGLRLRGNTHVHRRHRQSKVVRQQVTQPLEVELGDIFQVFLRGFDLGRRDGRENVGLDRHFVLNKRVSDDIGLRTVQSALLYVSEAELGI